MKSIQKIRYSEQLRIGRALFIAMLASFIFVTGTGAVHAQTLCARAKIEILQELTLERQAFEARMKITNGTPFPVEEIRVDVLFQDENGSYVWATSDPNDAGAWFFIRPDGEGATLAEDGQRWALPDIPAYTEAPPAAAPSVEAHWLIIPSPGAGGTAVRGTLYAVGAFVRYTQGGEENTIDVAPDAIRVMPMPELALDYFLPIDVLGDDPGTTPVEPVVPFPLGLRLRNVGAGAAKNVKIDSGQPKIVENYQGLLLNFAIVGSSLNGQPGTSSLLVNFGDLAPDATATAVWQMTCSLTGRFVSFGAKISHADELGGRVTSLIPEENLRTFALVKDVLAPGDSIPDFLACERGPDGEAYLWTLALYASDGQENPVYDQSWGASLTVNEDGGYTLTKSEYDQDPGYIYIQLDDPFAGASPLREVVRSDGAVFDPHNAWLSRTKVGDDWRTTLNLFDVDSAGKTYLVRYEDAANPGNRAPVLEAVADWTVRAGSFLGFVVRASDPDGTTPLVYAGALPYGASFQDQGDGTGRFAWTPAAGQLGTYPVQFAASDGDLTAERYATVTVVDVNFNRPPTVNDQDLTTDEDTPRAGKLAGRDPENDPLTFSVVKQPDHGTLSGFDPAAGDFTYTPDPNYHGADGFTFGATDGRGGSSGLGAVRLSVTPVDDAPTAAAAAITTKQNQAGDPVTPTVSDPDGDTAFTFTVETQPAHGTAAVVENQLVYTPALDYFGADAFTFRATDAGGLSVVGTADVAVVETPFDLTASGASLAGTTLSVKLASTRTVPVTGVALELTSRTAAGDTPLATLSVDLNPGENTASFDLGAAPAAGTVLSATVNPAGAVDEMDRFNNTASLAAGLPVVITTARPAAFAPGAATVLSGRGFYRLADGAAPVTWPLQGGVVHLTFTRDGETQPAAAADALTDRNGAWHAPLTLPTAAGLYRLAVRAGDGGAEESLEEMAAVDGVLVAPPPYPGPGGDPTVTIDDPAALEAWVVEPGTPVPTIGESGSGVRGGRTGTGDSPAVLPGGPALGDRGGVAAVFDAQVVPDSLTLSTTTPNAGERVQLTGTVRANDSVYGLPVVWRVTDPAGHTAGLAPATWFYLNGDLVVCSAFTPPAVGTYVVQLALAPGLADADAGNDALVVNLTARRPNHAPEIQAATLPEHAWTHESASFTMQATDADADPLDYAWNFGDGAVLSGPNGEVAHVYTQAGSYPAGVVVTDGQGGSATRSVTVVVEDRPDQAPVIGEVAIPATAVVGDMASFGVSASDPDGDPLTAAWDFGDNATAQGLSTAHAFGTTGRFTVVVIVSDGRGGTAQAAGEVQVTPPPNRNPVIDQAAIPAGAYPGDLLDFTASASDPDGDPLTYAWDFGDGAAAAGTSATHAYAATGAYPVTVTVSDGRGGTAQAAGSVTVSVRPNRAPVITTLTIPATADLGAAVSFAVQAADPDGDPLSFAWTFGDGAAAAGEAPDHAYAVDGDYSVTVTVSDGRGGSTAATGTIQVVNPEADVTVLALGESLSGLAGAAGSQTFYKVLTPNGISALHVTTSGGAGNVQLYVRAGARPGRTSGTYDYRSVNAGNGEMVTITADPGGKTWYILLYGGSTYSGVTLAAAAEGLADRPPVLGAVQIPLRVRIHEAATFSAQATDPDGDALTYAWTFGDGAAGSGETVTHAYAATGAYPVTVTASDGRGGAATAGGTVTVKDGANHPPVISGLTLPTPTLLGADTDLAVAATDPDGDPLDIRWDFGDGRSGQGAGCPHRYLVDGLYTATVLVADGWGGVATACGNLEIVNAETDVPALALGESVANLSGAAGSQAFFKVLVPPDVTALTIATAGGTGNLQLCVKAGARPGRTSGTYDYRSVNAGNGESVEPVAPGGKTWYILLYGGSSYAGATLGVTGSGTANHAPVIASAQAPPRVRVGETAIFAVQATDSEGDLLSAVWTFGDGAVAEGLNVDHAYAAPGTYPVTVVVSDERGGVAAASAVVAAKAAGPNQPPVVAALSLPSPVALGNPVDLGLTVVDPDGDPVDILWDFGDGRSGEGATVRRRYLLDGVYRVTVMANDGWGGAATARGDLAVVDPETDAPALAPGESVANLSGAAGSSSFYKVLVPEEVEALTIATTGGTGNVQLYVKAGSRPGRTSGTYDCRSVVAGNEESVVPAAPGGKTWYILLYGGSSYAGVTLAVSGAGANQAPKLAGGTLSVHLTPGQPGDFAVVGTDADGDPLRAWWDFGDGLAGLGLSLTHAYPLAGSYPVTVMVGDGRGGIATAEGNAAVNGGGDNAEPVLGAVAIPAGAELGVAIACAAEASDADGDLLDFAWNFGDGQTAVGAAVTHVFTCPGTYSASVTVTDGFGGSAVVASPVAVSSSETGVTVLCRGDSRSSLAGASGSESFYKVATPAGLAALTLATTGGTGNVQLYVKAGSQPGRTSGTYDYRSVNAGNGETVTITADPGGKTWYILLYGGSAYSGVAFAVQ